ELSRILTEGRAGLGFRLLHESGLLNAILPAVQWNAHLARSLESIPVNAPIDFAFAVLLHDVPIETVRRIAEQLKLSSAEASHLIALVRCLPRFQNLRDLSISQLKRFLRRPRFEDYMELGRIC